MKKSFKRVLSMTLAVLMLALMLPTGLALTASAETVEGEFDRTLYVNADSQSEANTYSTLWSALNEVQNTKDTVKIIVQTDTVENGRPSTVRSNITIEGAAIQDGEKTRYPVINAVAGTSSTISAWLIVEDDDSSGTGNPVTVTFRNLTLDGKGDSYNTNNNTSKNRNMFSPRENSTVVVDNCVVRAQGTVLGAAGQYSNLTAYASEFSSYTTNVFDITDTSVTTTLKFYGDCKIATTGNVVGINVKSECTTNLYIYGGTYSSNSTYFINAQKGMTACIYGGKFSTAKSSVIACDANATMYIYGGDFSTTGAELLLRNINAGSKMYIYGGTFKNTNTAINSYVLRPWENASVTIYGGKFTSAQGIVIGVGTSSSTGFLYVYGGTFLKTANEGSGIMQHNGSNKNYYIWGGDFYSAKNGDPLNYKKAYVNDVETNPANRAIAYVDATEIDKTYDGVTYRTAYRLTPKDTANVKPAEALFTNAAYQLTKGTTAESASTNARIIFTVDDSILATLDDGTDKYESIGFWASKTDGSVIYYEEYKTQLGDAYSPDVKAVGTTQTLYTSYLANDTTVSAGDGAYVALIEIRNITKADFNTDITVRAYAKTTDGKIVYGDAITVNVSDYLSALN